MKLEDTFSNTLKPGEKFLCMKQKTAVITMCSLLIFSCVYHFGINVGARWGKPCFIWWEHWATIVTFVIGVARLQHLHSTPSLGALFANCSRWDPSTTRPCRLGCGGPAPCGPAGLPPTTIVVAMARPAYSEKPIVCHLCARRRLCGPAGRAAAGFAGTPRHEEAGAPTFS